MFQFILLALVIASIITAAVLEFRTIRARNKFNADRKAEGLVNIGTDLHPNWIERDRVVTGLVEHIEGGESFLVARRSKAVYKRKPSGQLERLNKDKSPKSGKKQMKWFRRQEREAHAQAVTDFKSGKKLFDNPFPRDDIRRGMWGQVYSDMLKMEAPREEKATG